MELKDVILSTLSEISEDIEKSTKEETQQKEVRKASKLMEKILINELKKLGVEVVVKNENIDIEDIAKISYKKGANIK